jgi:uncharacterized SAM-binding protein YcdF (DUF218 family)
VLNFLLHPLTWAWVALWLIAVHLWRTRSRRPALAVAVVAGWLTVLGGTPLSAWLLAQLERPYAGQSIEAMGGVDALVTLGGGQDVSRFDPSGMEANAAFDRVTATLTVLQRGMATNLVLGGGSTRIQGQDHRDGGALRAWLAPHLPPTVRVFVLGHSRNTRDEATQSAAVAREHGWKRVGLVTSASHLSRATATFRATGLEIVPIGCDFAGLSELERPYRWTIIPRTQSLEFAGRWAHEVVGSVYYWIRGWRGGGE